MMQIDDAMVRKVATLGSIELSDADVSRFKGELSKVLDFVEQLDSLPLDQVKPTSDAQKVASPVVETISAANAEGFRKDEAVMKLQRDELMKNAPETEEGAYVVPNIL